MVRLGLQLLQKKSRIDHTALYKDPRDMYVFVFEATSLGIGSWSGAYDLS